MEIIDELNWTSWIPSVTIPFPCKWTDCLLILLILRILFCPSILWFLLNPFIDLLFVVSTCFRDLMKPINARVSLEYLSLNSSSEVLYIGILFITMQAVWERVSIDYISITIEISRLNLFILKNIKQILHFVLA